MDSLQDSTSSGASPSTTTPVLSSSCAATPMKTPRVHFQAADDLLLLREIVSLEQSFVRGATCWEEIACTLQKEFPQKFGKMNAHTLRERDQYKTKWNCFIKSDAKQRKQSGTEDEFKEKGELLESL
jgi:hypothetical protein